MSAAAAALVLAAEAAETSKTAFYVGGGLLALWAVVLALIGLSRPDFPRTEGATRGVCGISAVLVVVAMATAIITG